MALSGFSETNVCARTGRIRVVDKFGPPGLSDGLPKRARSSAVEHSLHTRRVTGSIPVAPTIWVNRFSLKPKHMVKGEASRAIGDTMKAKQAAGHVADQNITGIAGHPEFFRLKICDWVHDY